MLNLILNLVKNNLLSIVVVLIFILVLIYLWKKGKKKSIKDTIFYFVCKAEQEFGSKTGEIKYVAVSTWVYVNMPKIFRLIFTKEEIGGYIEEAVEKLKEILVSDEEVDLLPYIK
ncbi:hypothetical protein [Helicovermis profundi]|uniref:Uncharacterized protein n=1 Tax=Helicovermis profundi TaxID=3065157 RepID=A0AAU9E630_9FIRM|nr:hypothetical protein HLPR_11590 [Clostridia bacterium S502]